MTLSISWCSYSTFHVVTYKFPCFCDDHVLSNISNLFQIQIKYPISSLFWFSIYESIHLNIFLVHPMMIGNFDQNDWSLVADWTMTNNECSWSNVRNSKNGSRIATKSVWKSKWNQSFDRMSKKNSSSQSTKPWTQAILKLKPPKHNEHPLTIPFTNGSRYIPRWRLTWSPHCYPITNPATWKHLWLFEDGKWKKCYCTLHIALTGSCKDNWKEKVTAIKNFETGTQSDQHKNFKQLIQEFNREYLANDVLKTKKNAIYNGNFTTMAMTIMKL